MSHRKKCKTCGEPTELLCDGCDSPVCASCAVGPVSSQDVCPACFAPLWEVWLGLRTEFFLGTPEAQRRLRRMAFRAWVRLNPKRFAELVPTTRAGRAAYFEGSR